MILSRFCTQLCICSRTNDQFGTANTLTIQSLSLLESSMIRNGSCLSSVWRKIALLAKRCVKGLKTFNNFENFTMLLEALGMTKNQTMISFGICKYLYFSIFLDLRPARFTQLNPLQKKIHRLVYRNLKVKIWLALLWCQATHQHFIPSFVKTVSKPSSKKLALRSWVSSK